jgi:hypothetical protein
LGRFVLLDLSEGLKAKAERETERRKWEVREQRRVRWLEGERANDSR